MKKNCFLNFYKSNTKIEEDLSRLINLSVKTFTPFVQFVDFRLLKVSVN